MKGIVKHNRQLFWQKESKCVSDFKIHIHIQSVAPNLAEVIYEGFINAFQFISLASANYSVMSSLQMNRQFTVWKVISLLFDVLRYWQEQVETTIDDTL